MTPQQYASHLAGVLDMELDEDADCPDQLFGLFQNFMPDGAGVQAVFEPLAAGQSLYERIKPIYSATARVYEAAQSKGLVPGYFCPPASNNTELLQRLGQQHVDAMKGFAAFMRDKELQSMLSQLAVVVCSTEPNVEDEHLNAYLYDVISDWANEDNQVDELIGVLDEAYYSVNCDYFLAHYLRYPALKNKPEFDFLKPYFEIWQAGRHCKFGDGKLYLY